MKSARNAGISASVAPISAVVQPTAPDLSAAPSIKARPLWAAPSLAPNGALALTKSALTKIQLLEPAALERSGVCGGRKSIRKLHQIVIANHFSPFNLLFACAGRR
jgi:hypothetical protein